MTAEGGEERSRSSDENKTADSDLNPTKLYHLVYAFGITVVFGFADFAFLWPESHLGALLFLAAVLSLVAVYEMLAVYRVAKTKTIAVVFVIFAACTVTYMAIGPALPIETETHGWLLPSGKPTPSNGCDSVSFNRENAISFITGGGALVSSATTKTDILTIDGVPALSFERDGDKLSFDSDLFNEAGNLVARIIHNEFHLVAAEMSYQERSDDRSTLIVHDKQGNELLYIAYINPRAVVIRGIFRGPRGLRVALSDSNIRFDNEQMSDTEFRLTCYIPSQSGPSGFQISSQGGLKVR